MSWLKRGLCLLAIGIFSFIFKLFFGLAVPVWWHFQYPWYYIIAIIENLLYVIMSIGVYGGLLISFFGIIKKFFPEQPLKYSNSFEKSKITRNEERVLNYIKNHENKINISDCSIDLNLSYEEIHNIINILKTKKILEIDQL